MADFEFETGRKQSLHKGQCKEQISTRHLHINTRICTEIKDLREGDFVA